MWVEKEGASGSKESDPSLFEALLIVFPLEDTEAIHLSATEGRTLRVCCGLSPGAAAEQVFAFKGIFRSHARKNQARGSGSAEGRPEMHFGRKSLEHIVLNTPKNKLLAFIRC